MFLKINALKDRVNKKIIKSYVSAKTLLINCSGEKNLEEGVSLIKVFAIGGIVLGFLIIIFNGPVKEWYDATVGSWFKAGGEIRPV